MSRDFSRVKAASGSGSIGRMHIAKALVKRNFCPDIDTAFHRYLRDGGPAFVEKYRMATDQAVEIIHRSGGVAILAHPGFYNSDSLIESLFDVGLDGLEVYNPAHSELQVYRFRCIVRACNGLESGGSDFHGERETSPPLGEFRVPYSRLNRMAEYRSETGTVRGTRET